jgi:TP901 family phage tail tape measure protein
VIVGEATILVKLDTTQANAGAIKTKVESDLAGLGPVGEKAGKDVEGGLTKGMSGAETAAASTGSKIEKGLGGAAGLVGQQFGISGGQIEKVLGAVNIPAVGAAVAVGAIGVAAISMGAKFESATAQLAAKAGITKAAAEGIGQAFLGTAGQVTFSGTTITQAYTGVAAQLGEVNGKALTSKQALDVMRASMDLAEASGVGLSSASKDVARDLQAFQLPVSQAGMVTNVLFNASEKTGVSVDRMSTQMQMARSRMGAASPTIQELSGLMLDLAQHGETGRAAMSVLSSAFTGIVNPTAAVTAEQVKMGGSFLDASGKIRPMGQIFDQIRPKLEGMTQSQGIAELKALGFGSASSKLYQTIMAGGAAYDQDVASVAKVGSAHEAAEKATSTFAGSWAKLKSGVADALTELGTKVLPVLTIVMTALADAVAWVNTHWPEIEKVIGAAIHPIITAFQQIIAEVKLVVQIFGDLIRFVYDVFTGKWGAAWDQVKNIFGAVWNFLKGMVDRILNLFGPDIGRAITNAFKDVANWINNNVVQPIIRFFTDLPGKVASVMTGFWDKAWGAVKAVNAWLIANVTQPIMNFFAGIPGNIASGVKNFWDTAWAAVKAVGTWLNTNVWQPISSFFTGIPGQVANAVKNFWDTAWAGLKTIATWLDTNVWQPVSSFFTGIPGKVASAVTNWWDQAWANLKTIATWLDTNVWQPVSTFFTAAPGKVAALVADWWGTAWANLKTIATWLDTNVWQPVSGFFTGVPGRVAGLVADWWGTAWANLKTIGSWLETNVWQPVSGFFSGLPGRAKNAMGDVIGTIFGPLGGAWLWVYANVIVPVARVFGGLPGAIGGAISAAAGQIGNALGSLIQDLKNLVNGAIDWVNNHRPTIPFTGVPIFPAIPHVALGGYFDRPTLALIGEAGPEYVIPANRLGAGTSPLPSSMNIGGNSKHVEQNFYFTNVPTTDAYAIMREAGWAMRTGSN